MPLGYQSLLLHRVRIVEEEMTLLATDQNQAFLNHLQNAAERPASIKLCNLLNTKQQNVAEPLPCLHLPRNVQDVLKYHVGMDSRLVTTTMTILCEVDAQVVVQLSLLENDRDQTVASAVSLLENDRDQTAASAVSLLENTRDQTVASVVIRSQLREKDHLPALQVVEDAQVVAILSPENVRPVEHPPSDFLQDQQLQQGVHTVWGLDYHDRLQQRAHTVWGLGYHDRPVVLVLLEIRAHELWMQTLVAM